MKYNTLRDLAPVAKVVSADQEPTRARRKRRLERLADVIEQHDGAIRLLSQIEYCSKRDRPFLRAPGSALEVAYSDPALRGEGLAGDRLGDAVEFFDLTWHQAHTLFCDCHYVGKVSSRAIAQHVRDQANRRSFREIWDDFRSTLAWRPGSQGSR